MTRKFVLISLLLSSVITSKAFAEGTKWQSPESVNGAITTSLEMAKKLHEQGATFIDVRSKRLFTKKHITGAHHLDLKSTYSKAALNKIADKNEIIVVYCSGIKCSRSYRASALAVKWGYKKVHYFRGGVVAWRKAGYPLTWAKKS